MVSQVQTFPPIYAVALGVFIAINTGLGSL